MDLLPHEKATFIIAVTSDGRVLDATPEIMSLEEYTLFINQNIVWSLVFLGAIVVLLILNSYRWRMLKRKIYSYYVFLHVCHISNVFRIGRTYTLPKP